MRKWIIIIIFVVLMMGTSLKKEGGVCVKAAKCSDSGRSIQLCARNSGAFFTYKTCASNEVCTEASGVPECVENPDYNPPLPSHIMLIILLLMYLGALIFQKEFKR